MKEIVDNLIKEAAYHKAAYENTMRYLDGEMQKTASPIDFIMDGMSPASLDLGGDDWIQQVRETIANMGGGLSPIGNARVTNDSVQDAINEYLQSLGGFSPTGKARVVNDSVQDSIKNFLDSLGGFSPTGKARVINDSVQDSINDYSRIRDIANGIKGLGNDALNTVVSAGKGLKNALSEWGNDLFGYNKPQTSLADAVFQNGPITDNGGSSALVRALSQQGPITDNGGSSALVRALSQQGPITDNGGSSALVRALSQQGPITDNGGSSALVRALSQQGPITDNGGSSALVRALSQQGPITDNGGSSALVRALSQQGPITDNGGSSALVRALSTHGPIKESGPTNDPYAIFDSLQNNWKNGIAQHDKVVNRKLNISAWMDHMMENNTPGMDTFKNFINGITGKDLGIATGTAGLGGLGIAASRNLQNSNALAQQNSATIKDLQTKLQQQLSQNNSLTANLGARLRNAGNSALQAIKNNPKTSLAIGAGAAGLAALPFLMGGSEKNSSYDPYRLQMLRNALINMR